MQEINKRVYATRENLCTECYESLGYHVWSRTRESDTSDFVELTLRRENKET